MYKLQIREVETNKIIKEFEPTSRRHAEKTELGVMINLNHNDFYTEIVKVDDK